MNTLDVSESQRQACRRTVPMSFSSLERKTPENPIGNTARPMESALDMMSTTVGMSASALLSVPPYTVHRYVCARSMHRKCAASPACSVQHQHEHLHQKGEDGSVVQHYSTTAVQCSADYTVWRGAR